MTWEKEEGRMVETTDPESSNLHCYGCYRWCNYGNNLPFPIGISKFHDDTQETDLETFFLSSGVKLNKENTASSKMKLS